ncbi:MAG: hypothetical protein E4H01_12425 [Lysobacterales bacterium]|nr:MAG: hypothetical protein E4H01_12425 [Xanthomonadales bacterium]
MADICDRNNPKRVVDWRWRRAAGFLGTTERAPTRRIDGPEGHKWIRHAILFLQAQNAATNTDELATVKHKHPAIYWAQNLRDDNVNPVKWEIEARILARQDNYGIGFAVGYAPEIIEAYESLFFNVRDSLRHPGYVMHTVMGPAVQRGLTTREYDLLWKLYGYFYGPHMLTGLVSKCVNPAWCTTPDNANTTWQDDAIGTLKMQAALAVKTVRVDHHTQLPLMDIFTKFTEVERNTDTAGKAHETILESIGAMMDAMPLNIGGRDPRAGHTQMDTGQLSKYDDSAVELTYEQSLRITTGRSLPGEAELLATSFPEAIEGEFTKLETTP